jgi:2-polyprenyl-3-methyl-5-hydroxy-6-metoxy-1,4-benzoquinol methylase
MTNTEKTALRPCPVCGKKQAEVLAAMRYAIPEGFPLSAVNDIVACLACGMVYADTPGTQADYDRHYADFASYESPAGLGSGTLEEDVRRLEETADWLAMHIGAKDARIVDIGCAQGGLLAALSRRGFSSLAGIDPSARCVESLRAAGFSGYQGSFVSMPVECGRRYDFITASHVLEHVVDVQCAFSALRQLLAPGGKIYIEVPNAARYHNGKYTLPFQEINQEHINHFDLLHLGMLGALHGFKVLDVVRKDTKTYRHESYALGVLMAQSEPDPLPISSFDEEDKTCLKQAIASYILESQRLEKILFERLKNHPVALWGVGAWLQRSLSAPVWKEMDLRAVVDCDPRKQGKSIADYTIQSPEEGLRHLPGNVLVIITANHYAEEIKNDLAGLNTGLSSLVLSEKTWNSLP